MQKKYCNNCHKEVSRKDKLCSCGFSQFTHGENIGYVSEEITCNCKSTDFNVLFRKNKLPYFETVYECSKCKEKLVVQRVQELVQ